MQKQNKKWNLQKIIINLEYKKLLQEYNAWLIALITITLSILTFSYTIYHDVSVSLIWSLTILIVLDSRREKKSEELKNKINEIKGIFNEIYS